jgi:hypothetical protein
MTIQTKTGITMVNPAFFNASSLGHLSGKARWHTEHRYSSSGWVLPQ